MDDGPRTGALQLLILCIALPAAFLTFVFILFGGYLNSLIPGSIALLGFYTVVRLEVYARRRSAEERARRERRFTDAHLPRDPFL